MQLLVLLFGLIAAIAIWSWRFRVTGAGTPTVHRTPDTAPGQPRKVTFRYKAVRNGLGLIEDPREAAAIMMMEMARARGGPLTERQAQTIEQEIAHHFDFTPAEAEDLAAHAAGVTNSAPPPAEAMRQLSALIVGSPVLGPKEVIDLDAMLVTISEAEGVPTRDQLALLQVYRDKAGLKT